MRALLDAVATLTGYHVLSSWHLKHWPFADHLRTLFRRHGISLVLDVGANKGQYRDFLRTQVGYTGSIVSFEPIPGHVQLLKSRASSDPRWTIYDYALGAASATRDFNVMAADQWSSFLAPDRDHASTPVRQATQVASVIPVRVRTVAEIWPELSASFDMSRPYLKLDTQGLDMEVIRGATPVLDRFRAIQSEVYFKSLYQGAPTATDAIAGIRDLGFELTGLFPNSREPSLAVRDADGVFTNSRY